MQSRRAREGFIAATVIMGGALIGFLLLVFFAVLLLPLFGIHLPLTPSFIGPLLPLALLPGGQFAWRTLAERGYDRKERIHYVGTAAFLFFFLIAMFASYAP